MSFALEYHQSFVIAEQLPALYKTSDLVYE
jgi:hypothetical protein